MVLFMRPRDAVAPAVAPTQGLTRTVMVAAAAIILLLGVAPDLFVRYANVGLPMLSVPREVAPVPAASTHTALAR
jgi:hypothetical protein